MPLLAQAKLPDVLPVVQRGPKKKEDKEAAKTAAAKAAPAAVDKGKAPAAPAKAA
jgi:hypothetical protein